jgi:hypothetical protein
MLHFLSRYHFELIAVDKHYQVSWRAVDDRLDAVAFLIFGPPDGGVTSQLRPFRGKTHTYRSMKVIHSEFETIPFRFRIAHKENEPRELSIVHPRNQVLVSEFYQQHSGAIIYASSKSEYSIRKPVSVANTMFFKDKTHYAQLDTENVAVEQEDREYEVSGSYFVYKDYSNIHRFFESPKYHRSERRFNKMLKLDISKCFDSIYTHTLPWAVIGKEPTKVHLSASKKTFSGKFDALMQKLNRNETNGIVVGSEFSRIFSEIILQSVDKSVEKRLFDKGYRHRVEYDLYRYVDDYFLFYDEPETANYVMDVMHAELREVKLNINTAKTVYYEKPIITEITIAKNKITEILDESLTFHLEEIAPQNVGEPTSKRGNIYVQSEKLITNIKAAIKESKVSYTDVLNYTLAVSEKRCERIVKNFFEVDLTFRKRHDFIHSLHAIVEFVFFIYSGAPKVNHTIRVCRVINIIVETLKNPYFSNDDRHSVFKMIFDCARGIMRINQSKEFHQIETIYLLSLVKELGREYWMDASALCNYFGIYKEGSHLKAKHKLNYLSITSALQYMDNKVRYAELRQFMESSAIALLDAKSANLSRDTESLLMLLDMVACPYISDDGKNAALLKFGISGMDAAKVKEASDGWFSVWKTFKFGLALDKKRSREVY